MTAGAPPRSAPDELLAAIEDLRRAHGLDEGQLVAAVERAIGSAWRAGSAPWPGAAPVVDRGTGRLRVRLPARVVAAPSPEPTEIDLGAARRLLPDAELGGTVVREVEAPAWVLARAVPVAKAALLATVRAADRGRLREEALARRGRLVDGIVERVRRGTVLLRVGPLEVALAPPDQIPGERLVRGTHRKLVLLEVPADAPGAPPPRGSRSDPLVLRRLLEMEVPELGEGSVVVERIAREAGRRSKVAVSSNRPGIDPIGACIGPRGARIGAVMHEVEPERVDLIAWDDDPARQVAAALAPARVTEVTLDPASRRATVTVPADQLSLAIGRGGENARLAARLTGWRIDIRGAAAG